MHKELLFHLLWYECIFKMQFVFLKKIVIVDNTIVATFACTYKMQVKTEFAFPFAHPCKVNKWESLRWKFQDKSYFPCKFRLHIKTPLDNTIYYR